MGKINLYQRRDFSGNLNTVTAFAKQNYAEICKGLSFLIPILLIIAFLQPSIKDVLNRTYDVSNPLSMYASMFTPNLIAGYLLTWMITILSLTFIVCYFKLYTQSEDGKVSYSDAWSLAKNHIFSILLASFVAGIFVSIGLILCILPGLAIAFGIMFYSFVIIMEGESTIDSFRRSWELIKPNWASLLGLIILVSIISYILSAILSIPNVLMSFGAMAGIELFMTSAYQMISSVVAMLGQIFIAPIVYITIGVAYFGCLTKEEGIDHSTNIDNIGNFNEDDRY